MAVMRACSSLIQLRLSWSQSSACRTCEFAVSWAAAAAAETRGRDGECKGVKVMSDPDRVGVNFTGDRMAVNRRITQRPARFIGRDSIR